MISTTASERSARTDRASSHQRIGSKANLVTRIDSTATWKYLLVGKRLKTWSAKCLKSLKVQIGNTKEEKLNQDSAEEGKKETRKKVWE
jgi:hypothetical protein